MLSYIEVEMYGRLLCEYKRTIKKHWWQNDQLLHWHPMKDEIYENLCEIGNKDNILVIRNGCLFSDIFYLGKESGYKYSSGKKWHWGRLHYLKPQN